MGESLRVYLVEDSPILRALFSAAITQAGGRIVGWTAQSAKAIADLSELRPDVVVIDIALASGSGFDVLRALREPNWTAPAVKIVLTNYASAEYERLSEELGADRFFDKSIEMTAALRFIGALAQASSETTGSARAPTTVSLSQ
ncbi:MAG TPA: response regulator [Gaiellales bacterium]|nr:response regulator [Gaiellales bacterium]